MVNTGKLILTFHPAGGQPSLASPCLSQPSPVPGLACQSHYSGSGSLSSHSPNPYKTRVFPVLSDFFLDMYLLVLSS